MTADQLRHAVSERLVLALEVPRNAVGKMGPAARCC
jgi:hypothetical protein